MMEFVRSENEAHRKYFSHLYKLTAGALMAIFIVIAGAATFFGFRTVDEARNAARQEASEATQKEVERMRSEVRGRIDAEFKTDAIRKTVQEVAREQTQTAIMPIITKEVNTQVRRGVESEQGTIKSAMLTETHKAVDNLKPGIDKIISARVTEQVDSAVTNKVRTEVDPAIDQLKRNADISSLFIKAQSGDGHAFDQVIQLTHDGAASQEDRNMAERMVRTVLQSHEGTIYTSRSFIAPQTDASLLEILQNSPNPDERKAALDSLSTGAATKNLDLIFKVMTTDSDLNVREAGFQLFNKVTGQKITILDNYSAMVWWQEHRKDYIK